jgi:hypothetical protein
MTASTGSAAPRHPFPPPLMGLRVAGRVPGYFAGMLLFQMSR